MYAAHDHSLLPNFALTRRDICRVTHLGDDLYADFNADRGTRNTV